MKQLLARITNFLLLFHLHKESLQLLYDGMQEYWESTIEVAILEGYIDQKWQSKISYLFLSKFLAIVGSNDNYKKVASQFICDPLSNLMFQLISILIQTN